MADLALDLGPGCPVAGFPGRVGLTEPGGGQPGFVRADGDRAAIGRGGALGCERAGAAGRAEAGRAGMTTGAGADDRGAARGTGDGPGVQVDAETVLREVAVRRGRWLHLDASVQAGLLHLLQQLAGTVSGIAVDRWLVLAPGAARAGGQPVSARSGGRLGVPAAARRGCRSRDAVLVPRQPDVAPITSETASRSLLSP